MVDFYWRKIARLKGLCGFVYRDMLKCCSDDKLSYYLGASMSQISFRIVTLLVCLLGFAGANVACEKHNKDQTNISENTVIAVEKDAPEALAEEFRAPNNAKAPQQTQEVAKVVVENEKNIEIQEASLQTANADIKVLEFVLANKVEGREPKEIVENFNRENNKGFAFARLSAEKHAQVTFVWFKEGKEYSRFTTNVHASKKWRTYSSAKLRPGNWKVQLISGEQVLAEHTFVVQ